MEYLPIISKLIGSSLLALMLITMAYFSFSVTQYLFNKQILSYAISGLTLLILVSVGFLILDRRLNNLQFEWADYFVPENIISELIISVLMVISFVGTRLALKGIAWLFSRKKTSTMDAPVQQGHEQLIHKRIENEQILASLNIWINEKGIQIPLSTHDLLGFFAEKYWEIQSIVGESLLDACLMDCHIGVEYPPAEREFSLYAIDNPDEEPRFISLEFSDSDPLNEKLKQNKGFVSVFEYSIGSDFTSDEAEAMEKVKWLSE